MRTAAWLLWLAGAPACAVGPQATVELLPEAKVSGGTVVLGQVARIHGSDLDLVRKLVHLPLGPAPRHGAPALLLRGAAAQVLRRQLAGASESVAWDGAQETKVLRVEAQLQGEQIVEAAVATARRELTGSGRTAEPHARLLPRDITVPDGELRLVVRGADQVGWQRRAVLWVDVWAGGTFVRTVPVPLEVGPSAAQASQDAEASAMRRETAPAASEDREHGPLAVARGDWAVLRCMQGPIQLESRVEVLQDGRPGQKVRVRQQGATGPLIARVLGPGQLELAP